MLARLAANPEIQALIARNAFTVAASVSMILDLNSRSQDYRHRLANERCEAHATGRWRRCIRERSSNALLDSVVFEFADPADATALRNWLQARGW